ncbi:mechanosensitive ion channel family protein [Nocardia arthritidis]|uniref:Mechanosensitive ion channel n=1 Tax=Nocardia arthritidis TaxID=228602 RepID=A0A6G9YJT4_9NOCA|nr:mechanosensitive ion channel family protein [Nocardia arthritidis]QIS13451.1 mechanosensitive ion channel [Nocardia arthritidis]
MNQPLTWGAAAAVVIIAPALGFGLRKVFDRLGAKPEERSRTFRALVLRLGRDLSVPLISLTGLLIAISIPNKLPVATDVARNTLVAALIIAVTFAVARLAADIITSIVMAVSGIGGSASLFATITRVAVFSIGILISLSSLGISITPLLGALGIGGLAIALALQDTLANIFAGMHILATKMAQPGDFVRLDSGEQGWLHDVDWHHTTIREMPGNLVIVPNSRFAEAILTNYSRPSPDTEVTVDIAVGCENDLDHVERITMEVAREIVGHSETAAPEHDPQLRFHTFGDSIGFQVQLRSRRYPDRNLLASDFIRQLHRRFRLSKVTLHRSGVTEELVPKHHMDLPIRTRDSEPDFDNAS